MAAIFLTSKITKTGGKSYGGSYKDRVSKDIHTQDLYVNVRGQWMGRMDYIIDDAVQNNSNVHIFTRSKSTDNFIYQGIGEFDYKLNRVAPKNVKPDNAEDLAFYYFTIKSNDIVNIEIHRNPVYTGPGCLIKACLDYLNHTDPSRAGANTCFVKLN